MAPACGNVTTNQSFNKELLSPETYQCRRVVFDITLSKEPQYGIGITIVGGDSVHKHGYGIFVKSVTAHGPAYKDGRIKAGDQIIAINDESLEGVQHHDAVNMIKDSEDTVKLLISQVKPPGSLRQPDTDIGADEEFHSKLKQSLAKHKHISHDDHNSSKDSMESLLHAVHTPNGTADVNNDDTINEKDNKKIEKDMKDGEKDEEVGCVSIPECVSETADQEQRNSATVDVHSTLSQVDSLHSEVEACEIPADHKQGRVGLTSQL